MKKKTFDPSINLLDVRPQRERQWEQGENGQVVILIPKFSNPFLVRWLLPSLKSRNFKLKLDGYGSAFWNACDGSKTVAEIIDVMKQSFPDQADTMSERVIRFTRHLLREEFIRFDAPQGA